MLGGLHVTVWAGAQAGRGGGGEGSFDGNPDLPHYRQPQKFVNCRVKITSFLLALLVRLQNNT